VGRPPPFQPPLDSLRRRANLDIVRGDLIEADRLAATLKQPLKGRRLERSSDPSRGPGFFYGPSSPVGFAT
jgi:hypothetical protein